MFKSRQFIVRTLAMLALPVVLWADPAAAKGPRDDSPPSVKVPYGDLNLQAPQGVVTLYTRIQAAAKIVCRSTEGSQFVNRLFWSEWQSCINDAVEHAVQTVHNDNLSAYHWKEIRGPRPRANGELVQ
jgi:UrcA family protein